LILLVMRGGFGCGGWWSGEGIGAGLVQLLRGTNCACCLGPSVIAPAGLDLWCLCGAGVALSPLGGAQVVSVVGRLERGLIACGDLRGFDFVWLGICFAWAKRGPVELRSSSPGRF
jgi:hypothetical protein